MRKSLRIAEKSLENIRKRLKVGSFTANIRTNKRANEK
jgi:hypothetical protein